jgi:hypothetical protein
MPDEPKSDKVQPTIQYLLEKFRRSEKRYDENSTQMMPQYAGFRKKYIDELNEDLATLQQPAPDCGTDEGKKELLYLVRRNLFDRAYYRLLNRSSDPCQYDPVGDIGRYEAYRALSSSDGEAESYIRADIQLIGKMVKRLHTTEQENYPIEQQRAMEEAERKRFAAVVRRQTFSKDDPFSLS